MTDQTSQEVTAHEVSNQPPLPPGLDIPLVTAEQAANVQDSEPETLSPGNDFQTAGQGRPAVGTFLPGEPTSEQMFNATFNEPTEHKVELGGKTFKLVRLTQKHSLLYLSVISPKIQSVVRTIVPILKISAQSYSTLQYLAPSSRAKLLEIAKGGDPQILKDTFINIGIRGVTDGELEALINAAVRDAKNDFLLTMALIVGRPLGVHLTSSIEETNIASLIMSVSEQIAELAIAALESCARKTKMEGVDIHWIKEEIELIDTFECMEIVHKQFLIYKENAALRLFLDQIMAPMKKNTNTAMPTA